MNGQEEKTSMDDLMPDFRKWRKALFRVECAMVVTVAVVQICCCFFMNLLGMREITAAYWDRYIIIPTICNIVILMLGYIAQRYHADNERILNSVIMFGMAGISLVISLVYASFAGAMCFFCIPIFTAAIFSDKKMCNRITVLSVVGVLLASFKYYVFDTDMKNLWIFFEGLPVMCFLLFVDVLAHILIDLITRQNKKIIQVATAAREAQEKERAANAAKSEFLAIMSHEMRTPINAVLGMNEMILREADTEQLCEYANNIEAAGASLLLLINDILDISKIESGKMEIVESVYETFSFIHDICNMVEEKVREKGLHFEIRCNEQIPCCLRGDELRIRQVAINFLSNAIKYTPKGEVLFAVDFRREEGKFFLILTVKDTGIGIKSENLGKMFNQFQRFDVEKNHEIEGTGLGLAITKNLVDLMDGKIEVKSVYGVGSEFVVTIPQEVEDETAMGDFHRSYEDVRKENKQYKKSFEAPNARILVVDDVEMNLRVIQNLLKATRLQIDTAISGMESLQKIETIPYDIIFMDHMMRGMDGIETFHRMKQMEDYPNENTPVIMLTANALSGMKEQYIQEGFAGYLTKPVRGAVLEEMILEHLPPEKVRSAAGEEQRTEEAAGTPATKQNMLLLQELYQAFPDINVAEGLARCEQNIGVYLDVARAIGTGNQLNMLDNLYHRKDWRNYETQMHALKVMLSTIGFREKSERAGLLAEAIKNKDMSYVKDHHDEVLKEIREISGTISGICRKVI